MQEELSSLGFAFLKIQQIAICHFWWIMKTAILFSSFPALKQTNKKSKQNNNNPQL